ncbi:MAG: tetratricopeptide repeat protein, partial [Bryobacteraceae bacterium]
RVGSALPDATWVRARLFALEEDVEAAKPTPAEPGKTYALLVGVSKYQSKDIRPLNYAHEDALMLRDYLRSDRGGKLADEDIAVLINEQATTAAVRNQFESLLKARAGKNDTILLLVASHGTVVESKGRREAYIVTYDSNPEDLQTTALPMADVQKLIREDLARVGRVIAYVDVCRSGTIGTIPRNTNVNRAVEGLAEADGQLFLFTASRANEFSFEGPQYGGGHGAFSFFLMEAVNGAGDLDSDGKITINELIEYTQTKVAEGTANRQHPREAGNYEGAQVMADGKLAGIALKKFTAQAEGDTRSLERGPGARIRASVLREQVDFEEALEGGRVLPDAARNAFTALRQVQRRVKPPEYLSHAGRLQTALEDRGQQVILKYLAGEQEPQTKSDFAAGAAYFEAARLLAPESILLEARGTFCLGRVALFNKDFGRARYWLERAVRLDPEGAYSYNALGIAALEQADYDRAVPAFREAIRRAPLWAYPRHNLALAQMQRGDSAAAVRAYQEAMAKAPAVAYLPYNLGLVYQRLNLRKEAEASFRRAIELNPDAGMPYNALGVLNASAGRHDQAEKLYQQAIGKDAKLTEARHNLAVLKAETRQETEAIELYRKILAEDPAYLPSRLALAKTLGASDRKAEAIAEYREVVAAKPEFTGARLALALLLSATGERAGAMVEAREIVTRAPGHGPAWELLGDAWKAEGNAAESQAAYAKAMEHAPDGAARKRIRRKSKP